MVDDSKIKIKSIGTLINNDDFVGKYVDILQKESSIISRGILNKIENGFIELLDGGGTKIYISSINISAVIRLN